MTRIQFLDLGVGIRIKVQSLHHVYEHGQRTSACSLTRSKSMYAAYSKVNVIIKVSCMFVNLEFLLQDKP